MPVSKEAVKAQLCAKFQARQDSIRDKVCRVERVLKHPRLNIKGTVRYINHNFQIRPTAASFSSVRISLQLSLSLRR